MNGDTKVTISGTSNGTIYGGGSISNGASSGTVSVVGGDTSVTVGGAAKIGGSLSLIHI